MAFKDKLKNMFDKVSDAVVDAQSVFEKDCEDVIAFCIDDITNQEEIKAKLDPETHTVTFSGTLESEIKEVKKPWGFLSQNKEYFFIDDTTTKIDTLEITLKSKVGKHIVTVSTYTSAKMQLIAK